MSSKLPGKLVGRTLQTWTTPCSPAADRSKRKRIAHNDFGKDRAMFVAFGTIGKDHSHAFDHAIEVDDAVGRAAHNAGQLLVEHRLFDGLILQPLPAAAMQNVDVGKVQAEVLAPSAASPDGSTECR